MELRLKTVLLVWIGTASLAGCDSEIAAAGDTDDGGSSSTDAAESDSTAEQPGSDDEPLPDPGAPSTSGPDVEPGCGNGILEEGEECDGVDLGDATCGEYGAVGGQLQCTDDCRVETCQCDWEFEEPPACLDAPPPLCGDGVRQGAESCDGNDFPEWEDFDGCPAILGFDSWGDLNCTDDCEIDTSDCRYCGDGEVDEDYEECDGETTVPCAELLDGSWGGVATCASDCWFDTHECEPLCGNGVLDEGEECDGDAFGDQTCSDFGAVGGDLHCTGSCTVSASTCEFCGNGVVDPGESCDGEAVPDLCTAFVPFAEGQPACTDACTYDTAVCLWDGGTLLITEVMAVALPDPLFPPGEWVELHNTSDEPISLDGCALMGSAAFENSPLPSDIVVPSHGYVTLGSGSEGDLGFVPDAMLSKASALQNAGDHVRLECSGLLIDDLTYNDEKPWPTYSEGRSIALSADGFDSVTNDDGASWCPATTEYAPGYFGTPGAPNDC